MPNPPQRQWRRRLGLVVAVTALALTACGGGAAGGGSGSTSERASVAIANATTNIDQLQLTDDLVATELLDTDDGAITSLSDVVTGDRPVLLWYWAPH